MALTFKVNSRDLTPYVRVAHGDGLDPSPRDTIEPQFAGMPALGDGMSYVGDATNNAQMVVPLILEAASTDLLYALIRSIRADLFKGATIEYRSGAATASTFFDLEQGKLELDYEHWLDQGGKCRATLVLYRRPIGHSGTTRLLASTVGTGAMSIVASGLSGDVSAQAQVSFSLPSRASLEPLVIYGVKSPVPSGWSPEWRAASIAAATTLASYTSLIPNYASSIRGVIGASGAMASQYVGWRPSDLNDTSFLGEIRFPPRTYEGKHRVIAGVRSFFSGASQPVLSLRFDPQGLGDRTLIENFDLVGRSTLLNNAPVASAPFRLVDLGEINIPAASEVAAPLAILTYNDANGFASVGLAIGSGAAASYPIQMEGLYLVPLENSAGVFRKPKLGSSQPGGFPLSGTSMVRLDANGNQAAYAAGSTVAPMPAGLRGDFPEIPVGASGARLVALGAGSVDTASAMFHPGWVANAQIGVSISVRERFSYLR